MSQVRPTPLRRHPSLQPWSREHHDILMLCLKIRQAVARHVEPERITAYLAWTWENSVREHMQSEEKDVFPLIGTSHPLVRRALKEHETLRELFLKTTNTNDSLMELERLLVSHVRFEERELFELMQEDLSPEAISTIQYYRSSSATCPVKTSDNVQVWSDPFWLNTQ